MKRKQTQCEPYVMILSELHVL